MSEARCSKNSAENNPAYCSGLYGNKSFIVHDVKWFREEVALNVITFLFLKIGELGFVFDSFSRDVQSKMASHLDNVVEQCFAVFPAYAVDKALVELQGVKAVHVECCK